MEGRNIFISFNDILKTPDIAILKEIKNPDIRKWFNHAIDYTRFDFMNDDNLLRLCIQRTDKNILKYLAISDKYDYDVLYKAFYNRTVNKFTPYVSLEMVEGLALMMSTGNISKVFIYSEEYDSEIETEIGLLFNANNNKIQYVYGDIVECVKGKDISLFIFPDLEYINILNGHGLVRGKEVLIANYGFNYKLGDDGELMFKFDIDKCISEFSLFKLRAFNPFKLEEKHMSQIFNNIDENNNLSLG